MQHKIWVTYKNNPVLIFQYEFTCIWLWGLRMDVLQNVDFLLDFSYISFTLTGHVNTSLEHNKLRRNVFKTWLTRYSDNQPVWTQVGGGGPEAHREHIGLAQLTAVKSWLGAWPDKAQCSQEILHIDPSFLKQWQTNKDTYWWPAREQQCRLHWCRQHCKHLSVITLAHTHTFTQL